MCKPNSGAGGAETPNSESGIDTDVEARRIADELVKLHKAGAIKAVRAAFYANPGAHNGFTVSPAGKPYMPAAQRLNPQRGQAEFSGEAKRHRLLCRASCLEGRADQDSRLATKTGSRADGEANWGPS